MNRCSLITIGLFCMVLIVSVIITQFIVLPLLTIKVKSRLPHELSEEELAKQLSDQDTMLKTRVQRLSANIR